MTGVSRYGNQDLFLSKPFHTAFRDRLVSQTDDSVPFNRQIDLWWYALGVGVSEGRKTTLPSRDNLVKFNDGGILESDPWRITHLELLVLAERGESDASDPGIVIQTANEYVMTGCELLSEEFRGAVDPQLKLVSCIPG